MGAIARLGKIENRAARDDFAPVPQERLEHFLEAEKLRPAVDERDHVDAEHGLERGLREEIVEHHLGDFAALQLDDHAHAVLVGLVAQLGDAVDFLVAYQLGDALEQARLVHLVGKLGDDDGLAPTDLVDVFEIACARGSTGGRGRCDRRWQFRSRR